MGNIRATGEFVVNIVSEPLAEAMNQTAAQLPADEDEFTLTSLTALPGESVRVPRVAQVCVQMECRLRQIVEVSELPQGGCMAGADRGPFRLGAAGPYIPVYTCGAREELRWTRPDKGKPALEPQEWLLKIMVRD